MGARAIETAERIKIPLLFAGILVICAWLMHSFRSQAGEQPSPGLQYRVEEEITSGDRHHVTVTIQNTGSAPSMNPSGWVEFPIGEEPQFAVGPAGFEVRVRDRWKQLGGVEWTSLRGSQRRIDIRAERIQPEIRYKLHFYAMRKRPTSDSVNVHLVDDSGPALRVHSR